MNTKDYFSSITTTVHDHFGWRDRSYDIKRLEEDTNYLIETNDIIETKLRHMSASFNFLQIYKIGKLSWILDRSNKYDKFQYIKIYLGPFCYDEYNSKDEVEVKVMFLDECPNNERTFV